MYKVNNKIDTNGTSFRRLLTTDEYNKIISIFGKEFTTDWWDEEKGYKYQMNLECVDETAILESSNNRVITVYDRFGQWRIGARSNEASDRFLVWLHKYYQENIVPTKQLNLGFELID